ncbi:TetR/AcrR family transcriptional regulator [Intrasporangium mesophilum]
MPQPTTSPDARPGVRGGVSPELVASTSPGAPADATTVDRLMVAAAHAFADKGFHATTTRDIASGAGLSPAGVYVHFGSKEELLFNLSRSGHESALRLLRSAIADGGTPTEQLHNLVARFSEWHAEGYQLARVVQYEHHHLSPEHHAEVLALRKEMDALVRDVLDRGVADGAFVVDDSGDTALALLSLAVDVARWYSPTIRRTPTQIGATNAALALRLVSATP